jgi:hypothetical protein
MISVQMRELENRETPGRAPSRDSNQNLWPPLARDAQFAYRRESLTALWMTIEAYILKAGWLYSPGV